MRLCVGILWISGLAVLTLALIFSLSLLSWVILTLVFPLEVAMYLSIIPPFVVMGWLMGLA